MHLYKTMHLLHLIMTILFFPWALVWVWRTISNNQKNQEMLFKMQMEKKQEMKTFGHKAKAQNMNWEDIQEMQQQKKAHKNFRAQRQTKKSTWQAAEQQQKILIEG